MAVPRWGQPLFHSKKGIWTTVKSQIWISRLGLLFCDLPIIFAPKILQRGISRHGLIKTTWRRRRCATCFERKERPHSFEKNNVDEAWGSMQSSCVRCFLSVGERYARKDENEARLVSTAPEPPVDRVCNVNLGGFGARKRKNGKELRSKSTKNRARGFCTRGYGRQACRAGSLCS